MAVAELVSVAEYLKTTYRPDCDYLDGEVVERNLGEREHSGTQRRILIYLCSHYPEIAERLFPEQRVQVAATRYRVPDLCILAEDALPERIVTAPPLLCVEILSPEDRLNRTMQRLDDYFHMGVPVCWVIDPSDRRGWIAVPGHWSEPADGILRAQHLAVPVAEILEPVV